MTIIVHSLFLEQCVPVANK
jgi:hypothetical protein